MGEGELEISIKIENANQFTKELNEFTPYMKNELYGDLVRISSKEEKILKSTTGFNDVTGKLRRDLYVTATINPLGIEGGTYNPYGIYVAKGHGTWKGNWWETYKREAIPRIFNGISRAVERIVNKFNNMRRE